MSKKSTPAKQRTVQLDSAAGLSKADVISDYRIAVISRQASLLGRKEVLTGKAKFGIFGDGKEIAQLAMARAFQPGDWRSGYYRDQTFMFATGESDVQKFFAQLYAHTDIEAEPASAGRSMNGHFGTRLLGDDGTWLPQVQRKNVSADVSPTGSQMPRLVGLAYASRLYREVEVLQSLTEFSSNGNEVAFGTIGNASSAEGMFWESVNAIGVLKSPAIISIWDDGYGISVPNEFQVTKSNVGELLSGFARTATSSNGYDIQVVKAWDYPALVEAYAKASATARTEHVPQIIHVIEVTQPQGHSTSGSHERYKSAERLAWETEMDGVSRMRAWMIEQGIASIKELDAIEAEASESVKSSKQAAWDAYIRPIQQEIIDASSMLRTTAENLRSASQLDAAQEVEQIASELTRIREPFRRDIMSAIHRALVASAKAPQSCAHDLAAWRRGYDEQIRPLYSSHLYCETQKSPLRSAAIAPDFGPQPQQVNGSEVIRAWFDHALASDPRVSIFGEDTGFLGDVNQGTSGLQAAYGVLRVSDVGIRECTILGQSIGMAMRGLRPIAEIQYLDYLLYALQLMSDDLATVHWRTRGGQKAPVIVRTRGHRLEGIWHSGSPMAGIINLVRGMHVCVPRNFVQAAGMYQTLLQGDDPAVVVEVLNGYRLKENLPMNIGEYTVPLGVPEVVRQGSDITVVTYGATVRVALDAAAMLERLGIDIEVVDVQTLLPFDTSGMIVQSLQKTNRILFLDEDVPGGTTAFMMRQVLEVQNGYRFLDSAPATLTAQEHRPAYGTDGNFWSKPEAEHICMKIYSLMQETAPGRYPNLF
ncbi:MAG: thiamine pyrophosphate-dependent enzyme [Ignavibacteria bacterium]|jgi:2-oxoisovalerate dehydrogenase E1 component